MYLFKSDLLPVAFESGFRTRDRRERIYCGPPTAELSDSIGLDYVHLYGRDLPGQLSEAANSEQTGPMDARLALAVTFALRERPPGILMMIIVMSLFLCVLVLAVGHFHSEIFPLVAVPPPTAAPSGTTASTGPTGIGLIFGIPAILFGWMVTRMNEETLRRISVPTPFLSLWFTANAGLVVFVAAFTAFSDASDDYNVFGLDMVSGQHYWWVLLMLSCVFNAAVCIVQFIFRTFRYMHRLKYGSREPRRRRMGEPQNAD